jgi:hypothetical protein
MVSKTAKFEPKTAFFGQKQVKNGHKSAVFCVLPTPQHFL